MKKRISCKVIKSILLSNEGVNSSYGDVLKSNNISSYLNFHHSESRPVIYTKKMEIEKDSLNDFSENRSVDFLA